MASYGDSPRPYRWPPPWFENFLAKDSGCSASDFVIEAFSAPGERCRCFLAAAESRRAPHGAGEGRLADHQVERPPASGSMTPHDGQQAPSNSTARLTVWSSAKRAPARKWNGTKLGGGALRGVTTIVRKSYPGGRCYLLGELIQDTASRYYYRRHLGAKLAFVVCKSPSIHIMPCPACPDWLTSQRPSERRQANE